MTEETRMKKRAVSLIATTSLVGAFLLLVAVVFLIPMWTLAGRLGALAGLLTLIGTFAAIAAIDA